LPDWHDLHEDDDKLALRSRSGDAVALTELYRRYAGSLLRYLQRYVRNEDEAKDLLQECFLRLFTGRGGYTGRGKFRAWLFTVASRLAIDHTRQTKRHEQLLQANKDPSPPQRVDALDKASQHLLVERIEKILQSLSPEYAMAFHLRVCEGFRYAEISEICGVSEGTLRSRVHHTLRRVQERLCKGDFECQKNTSTWRN